jgi:phage terminase large subunit GpA-like protein
MDAFDDPRFSTVALVAPPQAAGKTDTVLNLMLKSIQHDHKDVIYMSANARKAADQWVKKFEPAIVASDTLAPLLPASRDEQGVGGRRDFTNACSMFLAGAESVANVSASTIPVIVCDDVQAMPPKLGAMGHPCDVAFTRSRAVPEGDRVRVLAGTASTVEDYLWRTIVQSTHFKPYVPCIGCDTYQLLDWDRLVFDESSPAAAYEDAWMTCENPECDHKIRDEDLPIMLPKVKWVARGQKIAVGGIITGDLPPTRTAGFWLNGLYWPFETWGNLAAEYVESRGDPEKELNFQQNVLVIPYKEPELDESALTVEIIEGHRREGHRFGIVPAVVDCVTLTVDVHDNFLYYIVRGWQKESGSSWLIDAGNTGVHGPRKGEALSDEAKRARVGHAIREALAEIWMMEQRGWPTVKDDGEIVKNHRVERAAIDGGYRPETVGQCCVQWNAGLPKRVWHMVKGKASPGNVLPIWPSRPQRPKRGHQYWEVGVDEAKLLLRELLGAPSGEAGAWHTYEDADLSAYHRHIVSEHRIPKNRNGREVKVWEQRPGGGPNHWWDCETYQIAVAIACGVRLRGLPQKKKTVDTTYFLRQNRRRRP